MAWGEGILGKRMKVEILGCSGNVTRNHRATAYLVNDSVLFDAGTVTDALAPARSERISHVFLSHAHLDHVKGLCSLAEEFSMKEGQHVTVLGHEQVLDTVSRHLFNGRLWPDFRIIPDKEAPAVRLEAMNPLEYIFVDGLRVKAIPVRHCVHTCGFLLKEGASSVMFTSDTGMTDQFWGEAQRDKHLKFIIAHVAFPDRLSGLAATSGHMTPSVLLNRIDTYCLHHIPFYLAHMKTFFGREIRSEIATARRQNIHVLKQGSVLVA
jgi:ribonuclease BN (tRNA processing enzyme)